MSTHDNLPQADGNKDHKAIDEKLVNSVTEVSDQAPQDNTSDKSAPTEEVITKESSTEENTLNQEAKNTEVISESDKNIQNEMDEAVAKDSEDEAKLERHDIETVSYTHLTLPTTPYV